MQNRVPGALRPGARRSPAPSARGARAPAPLAPLPPASNGDPAVHDEMWLLGQPPLSEYLSFVTRSVDGGERMDPRALVDAWRVANDHYAELETSEAGLADQAEVRPLPAALKSRAEALAGHPHFQKTFDRLPVSIGLVELDRLIVSQPHVVLEHVHRLRSRLDPVPDAAGLFDFALSLERHNPPIHVRRTGDRRFQFVSESSDCRFHEAALLDGDQVSGHGSFGPVEGILGLVVGYGSNLLSVIRSDRRLLLHNGYHRAVALRSAGITHAPAVIQDVTRRDELTIAATAAVADEPGFYFGAKRPPLIKDFFDPRIATVLPVKRMERVIEVTFEVTERDIPRISR